MLLKGNKADGDDTALDHGEAFLLAHLHKDTSNMARCYIDLTARIATLEAAQEQGFNMLSLYGVPEERARSVANGISVLVTRYDREIQSLTAAITTLAAEKRDAERYRCLTEDHADRFVREQCRAILDRMGAMSYSAASAAIDAALAANGAGT